MPANTVLPKVLSAITQFAGMLGTVGLIIRVWVTLRLATRRKESDGQKK